MQDNSNSPAVQSLRREQAGQAARSSKSRLQEGLEETFPASDPVSVTHTATAGADPDEAGTERPGLHPSDADPLDELEALRRDVKRLRHQVGSVTTGMGGLARSEMQALQRDARHAVRQRPLSSLGLVAAVSFTIGAIYGAGLLPRR
ncbi:hypothetical protein [Shinella pollutisoli]|uniref:DUF3618 domain-containing protein n=1 Tax=Shinella pollutisoli TaxID=2250594 RepID=A0ABV7DF26_9HYPH|nr:hypothetical protein [Shinella pollutisoli]